MFATEFKKKNISRFFLFPVILSCSVMASLTSAPAEWQTRKGSNSIMLRAFRYTCGSPSQLRSKHFIKKIYSLYLW